MFYTYKLIFMLMLFSSTMISISSYSWMGTWMGLEINLLSFIPLINYKNNSLSSESSIKYFLVQTIASSVFFFMIIMMMMKNSLMNNLIDNSYNLMLINSTLLMKMGAAPFHFWFPMMINGLTWMNTLILLTWQKIAPMIIISYTIKFSNFMYFIIIISTLIGSIGGLNQTNLKKIMMFSSINHIGWMLSSFLINELMWMVYFMIYSIMNISIIIILNNFNIFFLKQMFSFMNNNYYIKILLMTNFLSLGGLPPFIGFFPKWSIIQLMSSNFNFLILFMIMMSLITLFFYLRISYSGLMIYNNELNFTFLMNMNKNKSMIFYFSFISMFGLIFYSLIFNLM